MYSTKLSKVSAALFALVASDAALADVQRAGVHHFKIEWMLLITLLVVVQAAHHWSVMSSFEAASSGKRTYARMLLFAPYFGGALLQSLIFGNAIAAAFRSVGDVLVFVMVYLACVIAFIAAMFVVWVLIQGGKPETYKVMEFSIPNPLVKQTNFLVKHEKAIQGRTTSFDGIMYFNVAMGVASFILFCVLGLCLGIYAFISHY